MSEDDFVQQRMPADCAVAALAMLLGKTYEQIARHCSGAELVSYGLAWSRERHIASLFGVELEVVDPSLHDWSQPGIISALSLNDPEGGTHAVYWDGQRAWDPQKGRPGKAAYSNQRAQNGALTVIRQMKVGEKTGV